MKFKLFRSSSNVTCEDIELMLTEKSNLRYYFHDILWLRGFLGFSTSISLVNISFSLIKGQNLLPYQYAYLVYAPFVSFLIVGLLMFILEKFMLKNFSSLDTAKKFSRLKVIFVLDTPLWLMAVLLGVTITNGKAGAFTLGTLLFKFSAAFVASTIVGLFQTFFRINEFKAEIESKGLFEKM